MCEMPRPQRNIEGGIVFTYNSVLEMVGLVRLYLDRGFGACGPLRPMVCQCLPARRCCNALTPRHFRRVLGVDGTYRIVK